MSEKLIIRVFPEANRRPNIENTDEEDKNVVKKLIDAFITKKQLQKMMQ